MQAFEQLEGRALRTAWALTTADHTGDYAALPGFPDRCIQVSGTFGGATVLVEGSNDNSVWATLHDPSGAELSFSAAAIAAVLENPLYIRARLSPAGAGATVSATMVSRNAS